MTAGRWAAPAPLADEGLGARASPSGHRPQLRQPCVRDELCPGCAEKDTGQPPSPSLVIASERWGSVGCPQRCPRCPAWTSQLRRGGMKHPSLPEAGTMPQGVHFSCSCLCAHPRILLGLRACRQRHSVHARCPGRARALPVT